MIQSAFTQVEGKEEGNVIRIESHTWWDAEREAVAFEVIAQPRALESGVCSCCVTLNLSAEHYADGRVALETVLRLPSKDVTPRDDCDPFAAAKASNTLACLSHFAIGSNDQATSIYVSFDHESSCSSRVNFYDVRKWGPTFAVRIGETDRSPFDWQPSDARRWRVFFSHVPPSAAAATATSSSSSPPLRSVLPIVGASTAPALLLKQLTAPPLDRAQLDAMRNDGFIYMRNAIPPDMIAAALRAINHAIGSTPSSGKTLEQAVAALGTASVLTELFNGTAVRSMVEHFLGVENVPEWSGNHVQVALRYPSLDAPHTPQQAGYHIDGIPTPDNGLVAGKLHPFTMLIGVYLNDAPPDSGNLFVYPGSHVAHAQYFAQHPQGPEVLLQQQPPPSSFRMPPIQLNEPHQVVVKAGDVVLAHYLLGHGIAYNGSPNIRYALYFRVTSKKMSQHPSPYYSMTDPFVDWPALSS